MFIKFAHCKLYYFIIIFEITAAVSGPLGNQYKFSMSIESLRGDSNKMLNRGLTTITILIATDILLDSLLYN